MKAVSTLKYFKVFNLSMWLECFLALHSLNSVWIHLEHKLRRSSLLAPYDFGWHESLQNFVNSIVDDCGGVRQHCLINLDVTSLTVRVLVTIAYSYAIHWLYFLHPKIKACWRYADFRFNTASYLLNVAMPSAGAAPLAAILADYFGRKPMMLISSLICIAGIILQTASVNSVIPFFASET